MCLKDKITEVSWLIFGTFPLGMHFKEKDGDVNAVKEAVASVLF